ncbi:MAG: hypothetical protein ACKOF9_17695 [Burkholderiales bacterium]
MTAPAATAQADLRPEVLAVQKYGCAPADAPRLARYAAGTINLREQTVEFR